MKLKLGIAAAMVAAFCTLAAQEPSGAFEGQIAVNCTLKKGLSSRDAKVGQEIAAVTEKPTTINGVAIPRGSLLTGHVVDATAFKKGANSASLTIVFDKMEPKKGTAFPVEASVYEIALSENQRLAQRSDQDLGMRGSAAEANTTAAVRGGSDNMDNHVSGMRSAAGAPVLVDSKIPGVALSAVAGGERSAIMTAAKDDVSLVGGTEMVIGMKAK
ncbi:MAG TPA: hypothetical protein VGU25_01800 [Acidobacteriaceae bacterium]|nr:hypothetical protein [Acidobacteriaceae bacterium]